MTAALEIGDRRELFVDRLLIEELTKASLKLHEPVSGGVALLHHDRASLLAGKLAALLSRSFTKGRDLYDLVWYLSDPS